MSQVQVSAISQQIWEMKYRFKDEAGTPIDASVADTWARVARTLADLDGAEKVGRVHLAEALSYRALVDEIRRAA